jgi:hypothetical protein
MKKIDLFNILSYPINDVLIKLKYHSKMTFFGIHFLIPYLIILKDKYFPKRKYEKLA